MFCPADNSSLYVSLSFIVSVGESFHAGTVDHGLSSVIWFAFSGRIIIHNIWCPRKHIRPLLFWCRVAMATTAQTSFARPNSPNVNWYVRKCPINFFINGYNAFWVSSAGRCASLSMAAHTWATQHTQTQKHKYSHIHTCKYPNAC